VPARDDRAPGDGRPGRRLVLVSTADPLQLPFADARVLGWVVAVPALPGRRPEHAERAEGDEARAPAPAPDQEQGQRRSERAPQPRSQEEDGVGLAALLEREPAGEAARGIR